MRTIPWNESLEIEFKSDLKGYPDHDLVEEIVGMANTVGGTLYLGVEDDGSITGIHEKHRDAVGVTALIANKTVPPVSVRAELLMEEGLDVLKIEVPRSRGVVSTASGKLLRRRLTLNGSPEVIPMYSYEIPSRLSELGLLDYSAQPLAGATPEDLGSFVRQIWEQILRIITIGVVLEMCRKLGTFKWFRGKTLLLAELFETRHLGESVKARRSGRIF